MFNALRNVKPAHLLDPNLAPLIKRPVKVSEDESAWIVAEDNAEKVRLQTDAMEAK